MADTKEFTGTGRRKTAVARVRLAVGSGKIVINGRAFENYFGTDSLRTMATQALAVTESTAKYDVRINVEGGGPAGQAGAIRHGIARALLLVDAALRPALKSAGYLTRDPRMRERKSTANRARKRSMQQTLKTFAVRPRVDFHFCPADAFFAPVRAAGRATSQRDSSDQNGHCGRVRLFRGRIDAPAAGASTGGIGGGDFTTVCRQDAGPDFPTIRE